MSQSSAASSVSERSGEDRKSSLAQTFLKRFHANQRKEIEALNRSIDKVIKERDGAIKEMVARSAAGHEAATTAAKAFFKASQDCVASQLASAQLEFEKICPELIANLEQEAQQVDPDDAEAKSEDLIKEYDQYARSLLRWRRQVIKGYHREVEEQRARLRAAVDAEQVAKASIVIMNTAK